MAGQNTGDQELIEALRRGTSGAWQNLCDRYLRLVFFVVRKTLSTYGRLHADADVEDITFDLFHSLVKDDYRALGTIGPPYDLKNWLAVSARRRAIDFVRKKRPDSVSLDQTRDEEMSLGNILAAPEQEASPLDDARLKAVQKAMSTLAAKERIVVQLFYMKGKKYREIAKITGININSISPTLTRAVEKLQKCLSDAGVLKELQS